MKLYQLQQDGYDFPGRSPRGERGLKLEAAGVKVDTGRSLPPRGAWIEIRQVELELLAAGSLPPRGAWIEMSPRGGFCTNQAGSLPPRGAWIEIGGSWAVATPR